MKIKTKQRIKTFLISIHKELKEFNIVTKGPTYLLKLSSIFIRTMFTYNFVTKSVLQTISKILLSNNCSKSFVTKVISKLIAYYYVLKENCKVITT